jgi:hypothetical protein
MITGILTISGWKINSSFTEDYLKEEQTDTDTVPNAPLSHHKKDKKVCFVYKFLR